ncbi:cyclin-dependent kinase G-2 isoform X1, partial [Tanacetum coccineum]
TGDYTPNDTIWSGYSKLPGVKVNFVKHQLPALGDFLVWLLYNLLWRKFPATSFTGLPNVSDAGFDLLNKLLTHNPEKWFREVPLPKSKDFMQTFPAQHAQDRRTRRVMKSPNPLEEQRRKELQHAEFGIGFAVEGQLDLMAMEKSFLEANKIQEEVAQALSFKIFKILGTPNDTIWSGYSKLPGVKASSFGYNLLWRKFPATSFTGSPNVSDAGFDLLNKLLTHDPEKRITADTSLNHEWFREVPLPKSKDFMPNFLLSMLRTGGSGGKIVNHQEFLKHGNGDQLPNFLFSTKDEDSLMKVIDFDLSDHVGAQDTGAKVLTEYILVSVTSAVIVTIAGVVKEATTILVVFIGGCTQPGTTKADEKEQHNLSILDFEATIFERFWGFNAPQKDDEIPPIEAIIATQESELKLVIMEVRILNFV